MTTSVFQLAKIPITNTELCMSEPAHMPESKQWDPPITAEMREYARQNPHGWLYINDPGYPEDDVPPEGVVGAFRIDGDGEIDENFLRNDQYVPSALATATAEPTNPLEELMARVIAGEASEAELPAAVLAAEVLLYSPAAGDESVYAAELSDGTRIVPACTSRGRVPEEWPAFRVVAGNTLPDLLDGLDLGLNLHEGVQVVIPNSILTAAAD